MRIRGISGRLPSAILSDIDSKYFESVCRHGAVLQPTSTTLAGAFENSLFRSPPTEAEQRAIAAALSDVDALLEGWTRLIAKKRDLKQAAMQQLLTGQTRLPGFHGEWEVKRLGECSVHVLEPRRQCGRSFRIGRPACAFASLATFCTHWTICLPSDLQVFVRVGAVADTRDSDCGDGDVLSSRGLARRRESQSLDKCVRSLIDIAGIRWRRDSSCLGTAGADSVFLRRISTRPQLGDSRRAEDEGARNPTSAQRSASVALVFARSRRADRHRRRPLGHGRRAGSARSPPR